MSKDLTKERILDAVMNRMIVFGYRKVTMDEISRDLVMSKNTLYRYFTSKTEMAEEVFGRLKLEIIHELVLIRESYKDCAECLSKQIFFLQQKLGPWEEPFLKEIRTELPDLWSRYKAFQNEKIADIRRMMEEEIAKKHFRRIHPALAVQMYRGALDYVLNPEFLKIEKITFADAVEGVLDIWSSGIHANKKKEG